ncbi:unnamed protein product [Clonostachys rosea]|uniref:Uncharacterized protein n=1 Tax=Bionectria ochroleuca TaxID=29856 RepID=A0ABY6V1T1_BIOOC|nr:unnamed protein product [Clonostachys rosea]
MTSLSNKLMILCMLLYYSFDNTAVNKDAGYSAGSVKEVKQTQRACKLFVAQPTIMPDDSQTNQSSLAVYGEKGFGKISSNTNADKFKGSHDLAYSKRFGLGYCSPDLASLWFARQYLCEMVQDEMDEFRRAEGKRHEEKKRQEKLVFKALGTKLPMNGPSRSETNIRTNIRFSEILPYDVETALCARQHSQLQIILINGVNKRHIGDEKPATFMRESEDDERNRGDEKSIDLTFMMESEILNITGKITIRWNSCGKARRMSGTEEMRNR